MKLIKNMLQIFFALAAMVLMYPMSIEVNAYDDAFVDVHCGVGAIFEGEIVFDPEEMSELVSRMEKISRKSNEREAMINSLVMPNVKKVLNVRAVKDTNSEVIGKVYKDCGATELERDGNWVKIQSGNVIGWVHSKYLYFGEDAVEVARDMGRYVAEIEVDALRVRADKSTESTVLGMIAKGDTVEVCEESKDWIGIEFKGEVGYISAAYIDVKFDVDKGETVEEIEKREREEEEYRRSMIEHNGSTTANASELDLLAALIYCEAGGESYEGQVAVGAIVMNRLKSPRFPNTIAEVIFAPGQFSPAMSGAVELRIGLGSPPNCYQAAQQALDGYSNVGDLLYFRRKGSKQGLIIGNHVFY